MTEEIGKIRGMSRVEALAFYREILDSGDREAVRWLGRNDRFFLLGCLMGREDVLGREWCYERCREVEADPDGWLDLWSRFHYKSTIITLAGTVQEILRDPEVTVGILSYNKQVAHKFVDQICRALEKRQLAALYPEVLWERPPRKGWSARDGLTVRRRGNPKEPTVSGSGLVDGQPVGMHYRLRIYDDVVVLASVTTPEQIARTTEAWELSLALGTDDGGRMWHAGTRYHPDDTYAAILARGTLRERRRLCVDADGNPLMMGREALERMRKDMGPRMWSAQMLQDPVAEGVRDFRENWLVTYAADGPLDGARMARCVLVDSANAKRKDSDRTVILVVGRGPDGAWWVLDGVADRLNLAERTRALFALVRRWWPLKGVFWEQQGAMSDVAHVRLEQQRELYAFPITELHHAAPKADRIRRLVPEFEAGRVVWPDRLTFRRADGEAADLTAMFRDEYRNWPVVRHDDIIDCLADICDPEVEGTVRPPRAGARGEARSASHGRMGCRM